MSHTALDNALYLGEIVDPTSGKPSKHDLLYETKNLLTHAVCLGMTGSGKTGLGIALLEEAGLDKIPAIIIDPKGDLTNLLLTFPHLSAEEFTPWVDPLEAEKKGISLAAYAEETAKDWRDGLAQSHQDIARIQKLRDSVDMVVYTPANNSGIPISILRSFGAPSKDLLADSGAFRDRISSLTSTLLGLLGINADPIKSREHILMSSIIDFCWRKGSNLDLEQLIQLIQTPPIDKIGAMDMNTFFPARDRKALAIRLNNLLAAPGFQAWLQGAPLDIDRLLYGKNKQPSFAIFTIAHLSDSERMFFVTLLLNEIISWMRQQPGTSNLRALLYMDEIYGYFPPSAMPPSKTPMITLLKQARAFGLGVVLSTQNPVDLDYKGLANCGTWFIGTLQTDRDKARVLEGLKIASNGNLSQDSLDKMLALIVKRTFLMRSIYAEAPQLFRTRWTLSYLRGPLTLSQIQSFNQAKEYSSPSIGSEKQSLSAVSYKAAIPPDITELYANKNETSASCCYDPQLLGTAKIHFVDNKHKIDSWMDFSLVAKTDDEGKLCAWEEGKPFLNSEYSIDKVPAQGATFSQLPPGLIQAKNYSAFEKAFATYLYQNQLLKLYQASQLGLISNLNESEADFRKRAFLQSQQIEAQAIANIDKKYDEKQALLTDKVKHAQERFAGEQKKSLWKKIEAALAVLSTLISAFVGKRGLSKTTISQASTTVKRAGKLAVETQEFSRADESYQALQRKIEDIENEKQAEIDSLNKIPDISQILIEELVIHPKKSDISVQRVALLWVPRE